MAYVHKSGANFIGWQDIGGTYELRPQTLSDGSILNAYELTNKPEQQRFLLTNPAEYSMSYNGLITAVEKRRGDGWQAFASYTYSRATGLQPGSGATAGGGQVSTIAPPPPPAGLSFGRDPNDRQKMSTRARRARSAVTRVTWALNLRGLSLIHVAIHTGRTHQIRVHLSAIGHPIVGDQTYGGVHRHVAADVRPVQRLERPFLHAAHLKFTHPSDGRVMEFESPLPPDLQSVIDEIKERQAPKESD